MKKDGINSMYRIHRLMEKYNLSYSLINQFVYPIDRVGVENK